jgi:hypothetical protein
MTPRLSLTLGLVAFQVTACFADPDSSAGKIGEPLLVIGAIYNQTGSQAGMDRSSSRGPQLAVDQSNRKLVKQMIPEKIPAP